MVGEFLYNIVIMPIQLFIEFVFSIVNGIVMNPGAAIIAVSLVVNLLVLPLYNRSDRLQEEEREKQKAMKPWLDHIKKTFKGDERFMMTETYYRQQNYKPLYVLKSSVSLLLQVPFFIAAYNFLSNLEILNDTPFLFIPNLGQPDGLLKVFGLSVNLLPILMTAINIVSGMIYTKGYPLKEKLQLYGMALIFLVLLYDSPAGLVFYWTLNNVFSLCKNIVIKLAAKIKGEKAAKDGAKRSLPDEGKKASALATKKLSKEQAKRQEETRKGIRGTFIAGVIFLTLFLGLVIPMGLVADSPAEFVGTEYSPLYLVIYTFTVYLGLFALWFSIFFALGSDRFREGFASAVCVLSLAAAVNHMFFGNDYGVILPNVTYEISPTLDTGIMLISSLVFCLIIIAGSTLTMVKPRFSKMLLEVLITGAAVLFISSTVNGAALAKENDLTLVSRKEKETGTDVAEDSVPDEFKDMIHLDRNGKNVVVFMLDRAISSYLPRIFEEKPEIRAAFAGFTYYPNTMAFGMHTNYAAGALFGGYEYTIAAMDARDQDTLKVKYNEAIRVLPSIFDAAGYDTAVVDPPYANWKWNTDISIYDDLGNVRAYTPDGKITLPELSDFDAVNTKTLKRNIVCYSIFKTLPTAIHLGFYSDGSYLSPVEYETLNADFVAHYGVLSKMSEMTKITDSGENTFLMMQNSTAHEICYLPSPDYEPKVGIAKHTMDSATKKKVNHYCVNMTSYIQLAKWFDYLREQGVYDNTRIVIVADHGYSVGDYEDWTFYNEAGNEWVDTEGYNPLLLVKDFNSTGFHTADTFMTTADTPSLAIDGLFPEGAVNPFTGAAIDMSGKEEPQYLTTAHNYSLGKSGDRTFDYSGGSIFRIEKDVRDPENWTFIRSYPEKDDE